LYLGLWIGLLVVGAAVVLLPQKRAGARQTRLSASTVRTLEALIQGEIKRHNIPGLSAAVVYDDRLAWSNGYGYADLENQVPATPATVYRLASLSKPITAAAALRLAEQNKLDLDAPVQKYVPSFPAKRWPVTVRQLLAHQGGVRHYKQRSEFENKRHYASLTAALEQFKEDPLIHQPGSRYWYSTYGYTLLGAVIEGASGQTYAEYVHNNVFVPAKMTSACVDDVNALIPNRAQGYRRAGLTGGLLNSPFADTSNKIPGGGLCGSVEDLARFVAALMNDGRLLTSQKRNGMWTAQKTKNGRATEYGLGWRIAKRDGLREVFHGGAQQRVRAFLYVLPEKRLAVALMCNLEGASLSALAPKIADVVLAEEQHDQRAARRLASGNGGAVALPSSPDSYAASSTGKG
jgi:CubicO group peptidase (beta-lactamase class C family)